MYGPREPRLDDVQLHLVESWDQTHDFLEWLSLDRDWLGIDIETEGLNLGRDKVRLVQFGDFRAGWAIPYEEWRGVIRKAITQYRGNVVAHNLLFEQKFLTREGMPIPQVNAQDTMIMCHLNDPVRGQDLKGNAARLVDPRSRIGQGLLEQAFTGGKWDWATVPIELEAYWLYSALDPVITALLAEKLWTDVSYKYREAYELELACIHVLRNAEVNGMATDPTYLALAADKLRGELAELSPRIPVNPNSDVQVRNLLLNSGAQPWPFLTESGKNLAVKKEALNWVGMVHPELAGLCEAINTYRLKERYLTNYIEKIQRLQVDNIIRPSTRPTGARTSRMSVTDPPLQTLPRGTVVRDAFIPRPGHRILSADYSQMELRVMAHFANEQPMIEAFLRGEDLHNFVAVNAYGEHFTKQQRQICKNAQFAKIYGAGVVKFAATAKIPVEEAEAFLKRYDELFPGVTAWQNHTINEIRYNAGRKKRGYVELIDGRRIPVEVDEAYKGCNYKIQGSCAVVTKRKLVELDAAGLGDMIRLAVHDEILFEVEEDLVPAAKRVIDDVMTDKTTFAVPIPAEAEDFYRWGDKYVEDGYERYLELAT